MLVINGQVVLGSESNWHAGFSTKLIRAKRTVVKQSNVPLLNAGSLMFPRLTCACGKTRDALNVKCEKCLEKAQRISDGIAKAQQRRKWRIAKVNVQKSLGEASAILDRILTRA